MNNALLTLSFVALGAIPQHRIFSRTSTDRVVELATTASSNLAGISDDGADVVDGGSLAGVVLGLRPLELGGDVDAGDPLTTDDSGRAVKADPAQGVTVPIIGWSHEGGSIGVVVDCHIAPSYLTGQ